MKIVELLSTGKYVSGNEIGKILGVSRAAVHKQIKTLRNSGFIIESSAKGYRLVKSISSFKTEEVFELLHENLSICQKILYFKKINSTQTKLKNLAQNGEQEGTIIIAKEQSSAYGRMQRGWSSAAGGLWFSMLLKPKICPDQVSMLSLLIGLALNRALKNKYKIETKIKWSNDILFEDKKIAGIISEMSAEQDMVNWIAAGIGINVDNLLPENLQEAVSLGEIVKKSINRAELLAAFLSEFDEIYKKFKISGFGQFVCEYNNNIAFMNVNVTIDNGFGIINGINKGINEDGRLIIETKKGFEKIISGTLRRSM